MAGIEDISAECKMKQRLADSGMPVVTPVINRPQDTLEAHSPPGTIKNLVMAQGPELSSIAGSVLHASFGSEQRTLLVTSANAGEGRTVIASNIACSLARQGGLRTVLVDATLNAPSLHTLFEVEQDPGMSDLLLKRMSIESVLHETDQPNLHLLTAGGTGDGFLSLYDPKRVRSVLEKLSRLFEAVVFDGPPVFGPSDPAVMASCFNHVLLVVECERTRWEVVDSAKQRIEAAGAALTGVVLNRRQHYIPQRLYARLR